MEKSFKPGNIYLVLTALLAVLIYNHLATKFIGYFNIVSPSLKTTNVDYYAYYNGGAAYLHNLDPYTATADTQIFVYPPTFIPLYAQLSRLDFDTARQVWVIVYLVFFSLALGYLAFSSPSQERIPMILLGVTMLLLSYPFLYLVKQGQIDLIVASLIFSSLLFYINKHPNLSAVCLAAATLTKVNPAMLIITFVVFFRDWKYLIRFGAAFLGLIAISLLFMPLNWYWVYIARVLPDIKPDNFYYSQTPFRWIEYWNLNHQIPLLSFLDQKLVARLYPLTGSFFLAVYAFWAGRRLKSQLSELRSGTSNPNIRFLAYAFFLLNAFATLLLSPRVWMMAYVWFILPMLPILLYLFRHGRTWLASAFALGVFTLTGMVKEEMILNGLNMGGAVICSICLVIILAFPSAGLKMSDQDQLSSRVQQV
jgi:hypothetical protein